MLIPPMMTLAQARNVVQHIKYPPAGGRGIAFGMAHDKYVPGPPPEKIAHLNQRTCFIALIETAQGVEEVDEAYHIDAERRP